MRLLPKQTFSGWRITLALDYTHIRLYLATATPRHYWSCCRINAGFNLLIIHALQMGSSS